MNTDRPNATDGGAAPRAEADKAESDLDKLLNEFDSGAKPERPAQPDVRFVKAVEPVIEFAKGEMERRQREAFEKEVDQAVTTILEPDELKGVSKKLARGFLEFYAGADPSFAKAYKARHADPKGWQAALVTARNEFQQEVKGTLPGSTVKTDIAAAKAAISGEKQPGETPEALEKRISAMSNAEFLEFRRKALAEARG